MIIILGQVTYKLWVKTSIDKKDINYSTNIDDTDLTDLSLGFVSTSGNTINCPIIQTKTKDGSGIHNAPLITTFTDSLIDYTNSYYVQGTVAESTNNFTATGSKQRVLPTIATDGIYHLHLVDTVGNTYDSYLELGENNWKLQGTFKNDKLDELKTKLNVTVNLTDPKKLAQATGWLTNYDKIVEKLFDENLKSNGKGFDSEIKKQFSSYTSFLKPLTYELKHEPKFDDGLDKTALVKTITDKANEILKNGLNILPLNLNVDTSKVVNKSTLENYTNWIRNYDSFINDNKNSWISDIVKFASRGGFATIEEVQNIKDHIESLKFSDYLENITWTPNANTLVYGTSNNFLQYIKLDKFNKDVIEWTNNNWPDINKAYESALKGAESGLNLHGYDINSLLDDKPLPKTKGEIDNFANGISFHDYLQTQANSKFHGWQLQMGLGIGLPLLLVAAGIGIIIRWRTDPRYNPLARARKDVRADKKAAKKGQ